MLLGENLTLIFDSNRRDTIYNGSHWILKDNSKGQIWKFTNKQTGLFCTDIKFTHDFKIQEIKKDKDKDEHVMIFYVKTKGEYGDYLKSQLVDSQEYTLYFQRNGENPDFETTFSSRKQRMFLSMYAKDDIEKIENIISESYFVVSKYNYNTEQIRKYFDVKIQKLKEQIEKLEEERNTW